MTQDVLDDFEEISNEVPTVVYAENLNQGHDMLLGNRVKLCYSRNDSIKRDN